MRSLLRSGWFRTGFPLLFCGAERFYESFIRVVEVQHRLQRSGSGVQGVLGGSWVAISGVISPLIEVITIVILLTTLLRTTHEPPSRVYAMRGKISRNQALVWNGV